MPRGNTPNRRASLTRLARVLLAFGVLAGVFVATAAALRFSDASYFTPTGVVGKPYYHKFEGVAGCPPYTFTVISGSLPSGLTLASEGVLSGTPTLPGTSSFWVELADKVPEPGSLCTQTKAQRQFTVDILPALSIQQQTVPVALPGQPYSVQLTAEGGGTQTWSIQSGTLPPGITLSSTGLISGVSTVIGVYPIVVRVTDGGIRDDTESYRLVVSDPLVVAAGKPVNMEVGVDFSSPEPNLTGGIPPYVWAVQQGTLPAGIELDTEKGTLSGTPKRAGEYPVVLAVTDAAGVAVTVDLTLSVARTFRIVQRRVPMAKVGRLYRVVLRTIGGVSPVEYTVTDGTLPKGIRLNKRTGALVGKPRVAGTARFTIEGVDRFDVSHSRRFLLRVNR